MSDLIDVVAMHNLLLSNKPSGASHDESLCPICDTAVDGDPEAHSDNHRGGDVSTITQEELELAVANAVAPYREEIESLKASQEQAAIEARINEMTEAHETQVAELQGQLDTATAKAEAAEAKYDELVSWMESEQERRDAEAAFDARRDEVKAAVAEFFSDEYIEANLDRWASLDADAFEAMLVDWKAAAEKPATEGDGENSSDNGPVSSAMEHSTDSGDGSKPDMSELRRSLHHNRHAVRTIGAR